MTTDLFFSRLYENYMTLGEVLSLLDKHRVPYFQLVFCSPGYYVCFDDTVCLMYLDDNNGFASKYKVSARRLDKFAIYAIAERLKIYFRCSEYWAIKDMNLTYYRADSYFVDRFLEDRSSRMRLVREDLIKIQFALEKYG